MARRAKSSVVELSFLRRERNRDRFFGKDIALPKGRKQNFLPSLNAVPERQGGKQGGRAMYTGTLIEELMATVERAEEQARDHQARTEDAERWFTQSEYVYLEQSYQGVA